MSKLKLMWTALGQIRWIESWQDAWWWGTWAVTCVLTAIGVVLSNDTITNGTFGAFMVLIAYQLFKLWGLRQKSKQLEAEFEALKRKHEELMRDLRSR